MNKTFDNASRRALPSSGASTRHIGKRIKKKLGREEVKEEEGKREKKKVGVKVEKPQR